MVAQDIAVMVLELVGAALVIENAVLWARPQSKPKPAQHRAHSGRNDEQARRGAQRELRRAEKAVEEAARALVGPPPTTAADADARLRELRTAADTGVQVPLTDDTQNGHLIATPQHVGVLRHMGQAL